MKFLQVIIILCGLVGGAFGLDLLFRLQPGRDGDDTASTFEVSKPRLDENGEPMR